MYRIAICRKGTTPDLRTCTTGGELRDIAWEVIRAEGGTIADADHAGLMKLVGNARNMADNEGFAALTFGAAAITIRPGPAPTPTFPGGGILTAPPPRPVSRGRAPSTEPPHQGRT